MDEGIFRGDITVSALGDIVTILVVLIVKTDTQPICLCNLPPDVCMIRAHHMKE